MTRPAGLRLSTLRRSWFRIDAQPPSRWSWRPFPTPRGRFDPASGRVRVRYAADSARGAMRERFDGQGRILSPSSLRASLVRITGPVRVLDLRKDHVLDTLGLDDQINTSRAPGPWTACHLLTDLVYDWFSPRIDGIVYRSRTTPQHGANLALIGPGEPGGARAGRATARSMGRLSGQRSLLISCVTGDGFTIEAW